MADNPVSGGGEGEHVLGLGLDISQYTEAIRAALKQYEVFRSEFKKSLSIRLDPTSLNSLSNAFGVQMRQAVTLLKGANKESVADSAKTVTQINSEFRKLKGFEGFVEQAQKARKGVKAELDELSKDAKAAGKATGENIQQGIEAGVKGGKEQIAELGQAAQQASQAQAALAKGQTDQAARIQRTMNKYLSRRAKSANVDLDTLKAKARVDPNDTPIKTVGTGKDKAQIVDREAIITQIHKINAAVSELTGTTALYLDRTDSKFESAGVMVDKLQRKYASLNAEGRKAYETLRQQRELAERGQPLNSAAEIGRTPLGRFGTPEDLARQIFVKNEEGTDKERQILAQRKFATENTLMDQALAKQKELASAEANAVKEKVAAEKAYYGYLRTEEAKAVAEKRKDDADTLRRQIEGSRAYYRYVREEAKRVAAEEDAKQRRSAQGAKAQAVYDTNRIAAGGRAERVTLGATERLATISQSTGLRFQAPSPGQFLDKNGLVDPVAVSQIQALTRAALIELKKYNSDLSAQNKVIEHNITIEEQIQSYLNKGKISEAQAAAIRARTLQAVPIAPQAGPAISTLSQQYGVGARSFSNGIVDTHPTSPVAGPGSIAQQVAGLQAIKGKHEEIDKAAKGIANTHKIIGLGLAQQAANMVKWLFFYKAVHEITRAIENVISGFVSAGIEYTKNVETQQLALRGILLENTKISDQSGKQLSGLAALTALQNTSKEQWSQIQQASLAVVGTTADLMGLYSGILPFASRLGADLDTVQKLTKSTAVAAGLLDVSFQDARSALISLLQGRALVRNRLVGALGFTKEEVASLKGTPALIDHVLSKMDAFLALSGDASVTLAALTESFKDFTGIVAQGFTTPVTDFFKRFVIGLTDSSKAWSLFEKTTAGFKIKDNLKAFIEFTSRAIDDVVAKFAKFASAFAKGQGVSGLENMVIAIKEMAIGIESLTELLITGTVALANFVAQNRELIRWMINLGATLSVFALFGQFARKVSDTEGILGALGRAFDFVTKSGAGSSGAIAKTGEAATKAGGMMTKLVDGLGALGKPLAIGGVLLSLGLIVQALAKVWQGAKDAKERMRALSIGDLPGVIQASQGALTDGTSKQKLEAAEQIVKVTDLKIEELKRFFGTVDTQEALSRARNTQAEMTAIQQKREKNEQETRKAELQLGKAKPGSAQAVSLATGLDDLRADRVPLEKDYERIKATSEKPRELIDQIGQSLAQLPKILGAVDAAVQDLTHVGFKGGTRTQPLDEVTRNQVAAIRIGVATQSSFAAGAKSVVDTYDRNYSARVEVPDYKEPTAKVKPEQYVITADDEERKIRQKYAMEEQLLKTRAATERDINGERLMSDAELAKAQEDIQTKLSADIVKAWEDESVKYQQALEERKKTKKQWTADQEKEAKLRIENQITEAKDEQKKLALVNQAAAAERKAAFDREIKDVGLGIDKDVASLYGFSEESAVATFDRSIEEIKKKLRTLEYTPEQRAKAESVVANAELSRPTVGLKAGADDLLKSSTKSLQTLRQQESLLLQQFDAGEIKVGDFLGRIVELRQAQTGAMEHQIRANEQLASIQREAIATGRKVNGEVLTDSEKAQAVAELDALRQNIEEIKQAIKDVNSEARKVERAFQAWADLTGKVREFLAAGEGLNGTNTAIGIMLKGLTSALGLFDRITASAKAFASISKAFSQFKGFFSDAGAGTKLLSSFAAVGGLARGGLSALGGLFTGARSQPKLEGIDTGGGIQAGNAISSTGSVVKAGSTLAKALPAIGIGISAALAIGTLFFNRAVERAKKDITKSFKTISDGLTNGTVTLGKSIADAAKERDRIVRQYSQSKSGRAALKELLPQIDDQIAAMQRSRDQVRKAFDDSLKKLRAGSGVFGDFARELFDLEKSIKEYLDSFDRSTTAGLKAYNEALTHVQEYTDLFFKEAKAKFGEEMMGFEGEALAAQERLFSLINSQDGLYKQLGDLAQERLDLEESIQDEQERRAKEQDKINDLAKKELDIRKQIADIVKQAAEDEMAIRRRGVLEAQLSIAQQKAIEISGVRNKAQEEIDKLKEELAGLKDDVEDQTKANARKDRDFDRQKQAIANREAEIQKEIRLNAIRLDGARRVAEIEGSVFGMATDEFDLATKQNDLAVRQADIQVQKWRDTKALYDSIVDSAEGMSFEPPAGFPQIKVSLGTIQIDNTDHSTNTFNGVYGDETAGNKPPRGGIGGAVDRFKARLHPSDATQSGTDARQQGYGDVDTSLG